MLDGDMLVRSNIDDLFMANVPAAVMRGEADTCLYERRPSHTYFQGGNEKSYTHRRQKMKGGINGGLVLFKPDARDYERMYNELTRFQPNTTMAEQEFLSWFWGRLGDWNTIHKKTNFQVHQLYLSLPVPPPGQSTKSTFNYMVEHPEEINIFHFSADHKPSQILLDDMKSVEGWMKLETHLEDHQRWMMNTHGVRNEELLNYPEWVTKIQKLEVDAHHEWFEAWKDTFLSIITWVVVEVYGRIFVESREPSSTCQCSACGQLFDGDDLEEDENIFRDHILFNCREMASNVCIPVQHATNLQTFFFVPCGDQVESKLIYMSEVYSFYNERKGAERNTKRLLFVDYTEHPKIQLPNYAIPPHVLAVTEDLGIDASRTRPSHCAETVRAVRQRYERAMDTSKKHMIYDWRSAPDGGESWARTLKTGADAARWLVTHWRPLEQEGMTEERDPGASSSGADAMIPVATSEAGEPQLPPLPPTPPQPQQLLQTQPKSRAPPPKASEIKRARVPPPPAPPRK